jgi:hypothetical protein
MRKNMRRLWMAPRDYNGLPLRASRVLRCMRHDVAPQISENLGRHPTKSLKRLALPLAAARRTVQLKLKSQRSLDDLGVTNNQSSKWQKLRTYLMGISRSARACAKCSSAACLATALAFWSMPLLGQAPDNRRPCAVLALHLGWHQTLCGCPHKVHATGVGNRLLLR